MNDLRESLHFTRVVLLKDLDGVSDFCKEEDNSNLITLLFLLESYFDIKFSKILKKDSFMDFSALKIPCGY